MDVQPSLNKKMGGGGTTKFPNAYDPIIEYVRKVTSGQSTDDGYKVDSWKFWK